MQRVHNFYLLFLLLIPLLSTGQSTVGEWKNYTSSLDMREVNTINNSYIATSGGLLEFSTADEKFTKYRNESGLSSMAVQSVFRDSNNILWLGMDEGEINFFDPDKERTDNNYVDNYDISSFQEQLDSIKVIEGNRNNIFAICQRDMDWGLLHFQRKNDQYLYKDFYFSITQNSSKIMDLFLNEDTLFVATSEGLYYNKTSLTDSPNLKSSTEWGRLKGTKQKNISAITGIANNIYFGMDSTVYKVDNGNIKQIYDIEQKIQGMSSDKDNLGINTRNTIYLYSSNKTELNRIRKKHFDNTKIKTIYLSNSEQILGVTVNKGLLRYTYNNDRVSYFRPNTLLNAEVTALYSDNENGLIGGSKKGFSILKNDNWYNVVRTNNYSNPYQGKSLSEMEPNKFSAGSLAYHISPNGRVWSIAQRKDNFYTTLHRSIISGNKKGGVLKFNPNSLSNYQVFDTSDANLPGSEASPEGSKDYLVPSVIKKDNRGNLWMAHWYATQGKVISVLDNNGEWHHFDIEDSGGKLTHFICDISFGPNKVWFASKVTSFEPGSDGGLVGLDYNSSLDDKTDDKWVQYDKNNSPLKSNSIFSIDFDNAGIIWILTSDGVQKARVGNTFQFLNFSNGKKIILENLSFSEINKVRADQDGNIWITTTGDGVKVFSKEGEWVPFDKAINDTIDSLDVSYGFTKDESGLLHDIVYDIAFNEEDGKVYFATQNGISALKYRYPVMNQEYKNLNVFPSPFIIPKHEKVVIDGLLENSSIKIMTITGELVRKIENSSTMIKGRQVHWDGRDDSGNYVSSGVYIILAYNEDGKTKTGKLALMRK